MLPIHLDTVRRFLHVLAATVWLGGQLTLAALVPALRAAGAQVPRIAARAFNRVAWPAFGVLLATGAWNVAAEHDRIHGRYATTLTVKLGVVVLSGVSAALHARSHTRGALAVWGGITALSALGALLLGVLLAG